MLNLIYQNRPYFRPLSKSFYSNVATYNYSGIYCNSPALLIPNENILKLSSVYHIPVILSKIINEISKGKNVLLPSRITPPIIIEGIDLSKIIKAGSWYFFYDMFRLKLERGVIFDDTITFTINGKTMCAASNIHTIPTEILSLCSR